MTGGTTRSVARFDGHPLKFKAAAGQWEGMWHWEFHKYDAVTIRPEQVGARQVITLQHNVIGISAEGHNQSVSAVASFNRSGDIVAFEPSAEGADRRISEVPRSVAMASYQSRFKLFLEGQGIKAKLDGMFEKTGGIAIRS